MEERRLYGFPGAEYLESDPAAVWESGIEPYLEEGNLGPWTVEEWTVHPPQHHFPSSVSIEEHIVEWICDNGEVSEGSENDYAGAFEARRELLDAYLDAVASSITWRQAKDKVSDHVVTLVDGEPHYDGEPMYRPSKET